MNDFLNNFAVAITFLNANIEVFRQFATGIGPYAENRIIDLAINQMNIENCHIRPNKRNRNLLNIGNYHGIPDLVLNNKIIEFKICRPLRNNGNREDTWFKKIFEPNLESKSAFSDVKKLCDFRNNFDLNNDWEKWIVILGFERQNENQYDLDFYFPNLFNLISTNFLNEPYNDFISLTRDMGNRHLYHQVLKLYSFRY